MSKEKKYNVIFPNVKNCYLAKSIESKFSDEFYNFLDHIPVMPEQWTNKWGMGWQVEFTEQEIKAIDERYLAFKVEVSK